MRNKWFKFLLSGFAAILLCSACSNEEDVAETRVPVVFSLQQSIEGSVDPATMDALVAVFTNMRSQDTTHCHINAQGIGQVNLLKGVYNVAVEHKIKNSVGQDSIIISMRMENLSINESRQEIKGTVAALPANTPSNFIFSEVFFNGERNDGRMMHPDQYIVVFNPTSDTLYADGLCLASTMQQLVWKREFGMRHSCRVEFPCWDS